MIVTRVLSAFPLWTSAVEPPRKAYSEERSTKYDSSDEDIEEFLEKQRNVRLGQNDIAAKVESASSSETGFKSRSTRGSRSSRQSRSSTKSTSTRYSSFGKSSDAETDRAIRETIYEVSSDNVPQIQFSFFEDAGNVVQCQNGERVYYNTKDECHQTDPDGDPDAQKCAEIEREESPPTNQDSASAVRKPRHVTKMTILLTSVKKVDETEPKESEVQSQEPLETEISPMPIYSVIDKLTNRNTKPELAVEDSIQNVPEYAELNDFHTVRIPSKETNMEYCQHRALLKARFRTLSMRRKRKNPPKIKTVNSKLNKAWKSLRGWWNEEKMKLNHLRPKSYVEETATDESPKSIYESVGHLNAGKMTDEDGYCNIDEEPKEDTRKTVQAELSPVKRRPPHLPPSRTGTAFRKSAAITVPPGQDGFEELRRYIKTGGDFCKELSIILQERSEAELQYAKTLSKLSSKLLKVSKEAIGTVSHAWQKAGIELETTSEIHKSFATALCEEVVKPLKQLLDTQHRIRKSVENAVDKTGKSLNEWRAAESKSKKQSFVSARENEKLQDITLDARLNNASGTNKMTASSLHLHNQKPTNDKESSKLETKRKKAEESVKKSDVEYYTYCIRAERARLEWETAIVRGSQCFQVLEEERLQQLKRLIYVYWQHCQEIGPKITQSSAKLKEPIEKCDVTNDIKTIANLKGVEQPVSEQLLPDFYAEHTTLAMNRDRRKQALSKILQLIVQDIERERRGKNGVENLARAFKETPKFGTEDTQQNVSEKLHHMRFMLTYLEAARYKVTSALAELEGKPKPSHPLASHIHIVRDRQGLQQSVLKVPPWVQNASGENMEPIEHESHDWGDSDRGTADGNSIQPDSDFDEFSSQSSGERDSDNSIYAILPNSTISTPTPSSGGRCKALYQYTANLYDELHLQPGDIINIHDKQPDGWWLGELNGVIGIFPATYVEEIN